MTVYIESAIHSVYRFCHRLFDARSVPFSATMSFGIETRSVDDSHAPPRIRHKPIVRADCCLTAKQIIHIFPIKIRRSADRFIYDIARPPCRKELRAGVHNLAYFKPMRTTVVFNNNICSERPPVRRVPKFHLFRNVRGGAPPALFNKNSLLISGRYDLGITASHTAGFNHLTAQL